MCDHDVECFIIFTFQSLLWFFPIQSINKFYEFVNGKENTKVKSLFQFITRVIILCFSILA